MGFVLMGPATLAISLFLVVTRWNTLDAPALAIFLNFVVTMINIIVLNFQFATNIFSTSYNLKSSYCHGYIAGYFYNSRKRRLNKRCWNTFQVLKVNFFGSNFFDKNTCLVLLDYSFDKAIELILLST